MVGDGAFSHKIRYVTNCEGDCRNMEGHPNCINGSRVRAILLNGWILPIDGASAVEGMLSTGPTPSNLNINLIFNFFLICQIKNI